MSDLSNHVSLAISQDSVGVRRPGYGVALIPSYNTSGWTGLVRTYGSYAEVITDFPSTTGPEARFAAAYFGQNPCPEYLKIGKGVLPPTQKFTLTPVVRNSHVYSLRLGGDGVTEETVSYTSDADATAAEIVAGLITECNAVVGKNFTASGSTTLVLTGDAAGEWFFCEVVDLNDFALVQDHADPGLATDLAAIAIADPDFYAVATNYNSNACVLATAAWVNSNSRIYLAETNDTGSVTAGAGNSDTIDDLATLGYPRVAGWYAPKADEMMVAAELGACLWRDPGSETWKFKQLTGVSTVTLTSTQRANLVAKKGNSVETVGGVKITFEGTTSDGDFIDVQRGLDWIKSEMQAAVFEAIAAGGKVPYTDEGASIVTAQVRSVLVRAIAAGILTNSPAPIVTVPKVATISSINRGLRRLPDVKFSATLAGAIHKVVITGVVSV